jgi:glycosyltransferase involved in cell wall biosynthesis
MRTAAVMMVRNEQDIIGGTVCHALTQVDAVYVLDNGSTDQTREILDALAVDLPVVVVPDPERGYYQSRKMSALAQQAAGDGYRWIVPVDADEVWTSGTDQPLRDLLPTVDWPVAAAVLYDHVRTGLDEPDRDPFRSMIWRKREPGGLPKVAFRWEPGAVIAQGNHAVHLPSHPEGVEPVYALTVHHFPVRSVEQFVSKVINGSEAYAAAPDLPPDMGNHWRAWGELYRRYGEAALQEVYDRHHWALSPVDAGLVLDPAPYRAGRWS